MWKVREIADKVTNVVMNYTEIEAKVREATNDDAWGPTGALMQEVAQGTFTYEHFPEVMTMLWKRMLQDNKKNWRRTYKSLLLLNYLVRNGSERVVTSAREHIYDLRSLENYTYIDEFGKDQGINVRHKVHELIDFIQDDDKLREERKKAKKNKDKYVGMSSEALGMRFGGSGGWDDTPRWKKDEFSDWDPDRGGGVSRGMGSGRHGSRNFEDMGNNSDDGDRYDSDSEGGTHSRGGREYRDKDSDSLDSTEKKDRNNSKPSTPVRTKPAASSIKKIDLGAAAHYGRDSHSLNSTPAKSSPNQSQQGNDKGHGDLLSDILGGTEAKNSNTGIGDDEDFNPRASENPVAPSGGEFGDFTSAFEKAAANKTSEGNDDFADFTNAFNEGVTLSSNNIGSSSQQFNAGNISSHPPVMASNGNLDIHSNTDLLSGLSGGFSMLQTAPVTNNTAQSAMLLSSNHNLNPLETTFTSPVTERRQDIKRKREPESSEEDGRSNALSSTCERESDATRLQSRSHLESFEERTNSLDKHDGESLTSPTAVDNKSIYDRIHDATATLVSQLSNNSPNVKSIKLLLKSLVTFMPGPFTPQKLCGVDVTSSDLTIFYETQYGQVLEALLESYNPVWFDQDIEVLVSNLVVIDGGGVTLLYESLSVLTRALRDTKPSQKQDFIIDMLEKLVQSREIVSAVLDQCGVENAKPPHSQFVHIWEDTVQLLVSLPSRVSNKIKFVKDVFVPDFYCKILCCHIARCIQFLSEATLKKCTPQNLSVLSLLLSKIITNFNDYGKSDGLLKLISIFEDWCLHSAYSTIIQTVFFGLQHSAVEASARMVFTRCSSPLSVRKILGNVIHKSHSWTHVLCTKFLIMSYHDWQDSAFIENLVGYLAYLHFENVCKAVSGSDGLSSNPNTGILGEIMANLLTVWGDKSAVNHTPLDQHVYITQALILAVLYLHKTKVVLKDQHGTSEHHKPLISNEKESIKNKIFLGVPIHLESPVESIRVIGMITAEIVTSALHADDDNPSQPKLQFEYADLSKEANQIMDALKKLTPKEILIDMNEHDRNFNSTSQALNNCDTETQTTCITMGNQHLQEMELECSLTLPTRDSDSSEIISVKIGKFSAQELNEEPVITKGDDSMHSNNEVESDLDSDDDLIPYDMSNDVKLSARKRPKYLRDLHNGLLETEDPERFLESLEACEELVTSQLPNDDVSMGIELLEVLLCLEEKFCVDHFDVRRFSASVAIVTVFPAPCAEYLCSQFSSGFGKYSIGQRLFMLDCLAGAAKKLSSFKTTTEDSESLGKFKMETNRKLSNLKDKRDEFVCNASLNSARNIVQKRIESHTRRFVSAAKAPPASHVNKFSSVAGSFFFPLLYGISQTSGESCFWRKSYADHNCLLLVHFLHTLAVVMNASVNCPVATRMGKELLDFCWNLRYHSEAKVRLAVMVCVGAVLMAVPRSRLLELQELVLEFRLWLIEASETGVGRGDPDSDCREFALYVTWLIGNTVNENVFASGFVN
ncbi:telomere length regulation protein TEL2 homolog isoform X1 [Periplaneta americana]|uniref:telomere length regulation protein TEL2 homolog isoform X1 n=1 Tax=Periplaneta americana TaxID=6978 RepID=UPI0037E99305